MSATVTIDASGFMTQMARLVTELGQDAESALRTQSRLLGERLIHFTPPKTLSIGRSSVDRDLNKVAKFPEPTGIRNEKLRTSMRKIIARKDYDGLQALAQTLYPRERYRVEPFVPKHHREAQSQRTYRVRVNSNRLSLNFADFKRYVVQIKKHVGRLRAGWIPLLTFGRGTAAQWVQRHASLALAPHVVLTPNVKSIAVTNRGVGITRLADRFRDAVKSRERDMKKWIKVQLRLKKRQLKMAA